MEGEKKSSYTKHKKNYYQRKQQMILAAMAEKRREENSFVYEKLEALSDEDKKVIYNSLVNKYLVYTNELIESLLQASNNKSQYEKQESLLV